ncbi:hypothetical protein BH09BAC6_BH09BAC6_12750 [soil metagenome]|jgi:RNA recognition motif-containing protein
MTKLFVGGFPLDITELDLVQRISLYGTVSTIKIVRDKKTRVCKGYAFLEMTDMEGAQNAIEALDGTTIGGRVLSLAIREDDPAPAPPKNPYSYAKSGTPSRNNYVKVERSPDLTKRKRTRKQF